MPEQRPSPPAYKIPAARPPGRPISARSETIATITYSPLIVTASGSVRDTVFARWKGHPYIRSRIRPGDPHTTAQLRQRAIIRAGITMWQNLHGDLVTAWNQYASPYAITGHNAHMHRNCSRATILGADAGARTELLGYYPPALMHPTPGAKQLEQCLIVEHFPEGIEVTWNTSGWSYADSVYIALWSEEVGPYYIQPAIPISKVPGAIGSLIIGGLGSHNYYTVAVIVHDKSEDTWGINHGVKQERSGG